jgi:hypothetical protein
MLYLLDLDGTLFDCSDRLHYINGEVKDWNAFFDACVNDTPILPVLYTIRALQAQEYSIVVITGRPERIRQQSLSLLSQHGVQPTKVYMRKDGDHREDFVVKSELLDEVIQDFPGHMIVGAFEDRQQVVDMLCSRGVHVFQVAKGDF